MWTRAILGIVLCAVGALFIGQGAGAVHGSFMTGRPFWAYVGGGLLAVGLALLVWAWREHGGG
jgi:hypothetical protein